MSCKIPQYFILYEQDYPIYFNRINYIYYYITNAKITRQNVNIFNPYEKILSKISGNFLNI